MDMQRKLDDFTHGQIELSRQQAEATKEFNKRFDQLTSLLTFQNAPPRVQRYAASTSSHQSSVHGMGEEHHNDTPQSFVRPLGQTQQLQSPFGADPNNNRPAKLTNTFPPLILEGPPQAPDTQQDDATQQWIVNLNTHPQNNAEGGHTGGGINGPGQREEATAQAQFLPN
jgi:hypothetical protein